MAISPQMAMNHFHTKLQIFRSKHTPNDKINLVRMAGRGLGLREMVCLRGGADRTENLLLIEKR